MSKHLHIIIIAIIFILILLVTTFYYYTHAGKTPSLNPQIPGANSGNIIDVDGNLNIPTEGNDTIFSTNVDTTIRVVNEYDSAFFTADKNLLIMFASWCPNCQEEIKETEKILEHFKSNKNVNIVVIAHEYENSVNDLINLIEYNVNFGKIEVKLDLGRVIRKKIDPEASTIPMSYVVDKKGNVLEKYDESLTLEKAIEMVGK